MCSFIAIVFYVVYSCNVSTGLCHIYGHLSMQEFLPWCSSSMRFVFLRIDYQISCRLNSIKAKDCPWSRAWGLSPLNPPRGKLRLCPQRHHERSNSSRTKWETCENEILTVHLQTAFTRTIIKSIVSVRPFVSTCTMCFQSTQLRLWPLACVKKCSPYSITERRVPELIPVLGSQPAGDVSHQPGGRLPLLSARRPAVTPATLKRAATNFAAWWTEARWVWTVCLRLLLESVAAAIWTQALSRLSPAR